MTNDGTLKVASPVTPIESKQPQAQCEFTIHATLRGFPVEIKGSGRAGDLKIIVDRLFDLGAEPPALQNLQKAEPTKAAGVPVCPIHGTKMKPSRKPGSFFCPRQAEDGDGYCPEKA
jgi:hypothetical protein